MHWNEFSRGAAWGIAIVAMGQAIKEFDHYLRMKEYLDQMSASGWDIWE